MFTGIFRANVWETSHALEHKPGDKPLVVTLSGAGQLACLGKIPLSRTNIFPSEISIEDIKTFPHDENDPEPRCFQGPAGFSFQWHFQTGILPVDFLHRDQSDFAGIDAENFSQPDSSRFGSLILDNGSNRSRATLTSQVRLYFALCSVREYAYPILAAISRGPYIYLVAILFAVL